MDRLFQDDEYDFCLWEKTAGWELEVRYEDCRAHGDASLRDDLLYATDDSAARRNERYLKWFSAAPAFYGSQVVDLSDYLVCVVQTNRVLIDDDAGWRFAIKEN